MKKFLLAALMSVCVVTGAQAHDGVHVENAYALETSDSASVGAVFMDIKAPEASEPDALVKIVTPRADKAEIHTVTTDDMGVTKMRALDRLPIPAKQTTVLKQGGNHVMLMGLHGALKPGEIFPLVLTFERGETITVDVPVKSMSDFSMPTMMDHDTHVDMNHHAH